MNFIHDKRHKIEKGKGRAHPVFLFLINKMEQIGQYDHSNNYSKEDDYKVLDTQRLERARACLRQSASLDAHPIFGLLYLLS